MKRPWYLVATLSPGMKNSIEIEVYLEQQISKEGPKMGFATLREGA